MSAKLRYWMLRLMILGVPLLVMGCHNERDFRTGDILDIIDEVGNVVVDIIRAAT